MVHGMSPSWNCFFDLLAMDHCAPAIPLSHSGPKSAMLAHFIFVRVKAQNVVFEAGTFNNVRTVQTQRNIVSTHPQIMSIVPRPSGELAHPSLVSVPLLSDIEFGLSEVEIRC